MIKHPLKVILCFLVCLALSVGLVFSVSAASFTLYSSLSGDDSVCNRLIGLYRNSDSYSPYNQFLVCRTGQYEYYLFSGSDLTQSYDYIRYYALTSGYSSQWNISYGSGNSLSINYNSYVPVGNVSESVSSALAEEFKFQYVAIVLLSLVAIVILFKVFRFRFKTAEQKGWSYG